MPFDSFIQLLVVAAIAGYVGYMLGRASAARGMSAPQDDRASQLPGPADMPEPAAHRPRQGTPPPAGAGGGSASSGGPARQGTPPRRSTPPPAAAGLLDKDGA